MPPELLDPVIHVDHSRYHVVVRVKLLKDKSSRSIMGGGAMDIWHDTPRGGWLGEQPLMLRHSVLSGCSFGLEVFKGSYEKLL